MFKKILHPTDFSPVALQAFDQAVALALRYGAELQLLHAVVLHEYDNPAINEGLKKLNEAYESLRNELKAQMEEMVAQSDLADDKCSIVLKRGFGAGDVIISTAQESGADLIVMGTHGHSPVRHFFLGSVAEKVVRYSPCPVMVLGSVEETPGKFENILLPVDFSETSHKAADLAVALAKTHKARVSLLHVFQNLVPPIYSVDNVAWDSTLMERAKEELKKFMTRHRTEEVKMVSNLIEGRIPRAIVDFSQKEHCDLIVMGTAGLTGVHRFLLGSVAEKVLRKSEIPVLTVRAEPDED